MYKGNKKLKLSLGGKWGHDSVVHGGNYEVRGTKGSD